MNNEAMIRSHDRVSEDEGRRRVTGRAVHPTATPPFHCVSPRTLLASDGGDLENGGVAKSDCDCICASSMLAPAPATVILRVKAMSSKTFRCGSPSHHAVNAPPPLRLLPPPATTCELRRTIEIQTDCSTMKRREVGVRQ